MQATRNAAGLVSIRFPYCANANRCTQPYFDNSVHLQVTRHSIQRTQLPTAHATHLQGTNPTYSSQAFTRAAIAKAQKHFYKGRKISRSFYDFINLVIVLTIFFIVFLFPDVIPDFIQVLLI